MRFQAITLVLVSVSLAACGDSGPAERSAEEMQAVAARAAELRPEDTALAAIYDRSCRNCHAVPGSGAPLTGDAEAWGPRVAQGGQVLLDHTIRGYNGMPPLGMCPDCSLDEFRVLIDFMTAGSGE